MHGSNVQGMNLIVSKYTVVEKEAVLSVATVPSEPERSFTPTRGDCYRFDFLSLGNGKNVHNVNRIFVGKSKVSPHQLLRSA